jgi:hypothetical protein
VTVTECTGPLTPGGVSVGIAHCAITNRFLAESATESKQKILLFELALVLVRLDHVASRIVNANHKRSGLLTRIGGDGKRFIVRSDEILTAFVELQSAIHEFAVGLMLKS